MQLKIYNYREDSELINSFLESAAISHKHNKVKDEEWFNWKFRDNPYGEAILACAIDNEKIIGCVALGKHVLNIKGIKYSCALSYETFVHPNYQGKGLFKKLILLAEEEAIKQEIQVLINFPNSNSLPGFLKMNWNKLDVPEYWLKMVNIFNVIKNIKDLKKSFIPLDSNLKDIKRVEFKECLHDKIYIETSQEFFNWRFYQYPVNNYHIVKDNDNLAIGRLGRRGELEELQILLCSSDFNLSKMIKLFKLKVNFDILSFPISKKNVLKKKLASQLFFKVPNNINVCYKIIGNDIPIDTNMTELSLNAINYHTY
ncbi:GNAT family N-acetyltransferase [Empedobacter stercoris]|uniref:GNAT family N-acetyltransferase n=1 Tax=Empedobacter stercoris TaxID=1628248 RepID=UPI0039E8F245